MNLFTFYRNSIKTLSVAGCDSPEFDVQQLFDFCLKINKTQLLLRANESIDNFDTSFFNECLEKRKNRIPLQYIIGEWGFYKYNFKDFYRYNGYNYIISICIYDFVKFYDIPRSY